MKYLPRVLFAAALIFFVAGIVYLMSQ